MELWWKGIPGRGNREGKSPKAGGSLMSLEQLGEGVARTLYFVLSVRGEPLGNFQ